MKLWDHRGEHNSISGALQLELPVRAVISLTGSGGKTSLLLAWARELAASGKRTIITTTAHMLRPGRAEQGVRDIYEDIGIILCDASGGISSDEERRVCDAIDTALDAGSLIMAASPDPERPSKVMSPPPRILRHFFETADAVLIEADGSRRMPLKWPAPWEPAVPDETDITVCVAGLSALGRDPADVMYRAGDLPQDLRRDTVDEMFISAVLASPEGGRKSVRGEFRVFLNQADNEALRGSAERIRRMLAVRGITSAWGTLLEQ